VYLYAQESVLASEDTSCPQQGVTLSLQMEGEWDTKWVWIACVYVCVCSCVFRGYGAMMRQMEFLCTTIAQPQRACVCEGECMRVDAGG